MAVVPFKRKKPDEFVRISVLECLAASYTAPSPFGDVLFQLVVEARASLDTFASVPESVYADSAAAPHVNSAHPGHRDARVAFYRGEL